MSNLGVVLLILLILALTGGFHMRSSWGYGPPGIVGVILVVVIVLLVLGKL